MNKEQIISKGFYRFSQVSNFISVRNYIFLKSGDDTCLAIRFSNDTDVTFDSLTFSIIQLDASGKEIGRKTVNYENISFAPGTMYACGNAVKVEAGCVDFRIQFYEAHSGHYRYAVRRKRVYVYYMKNTLTENKDADAYVHTADTDAKCRPLKYESRGLVGFFAAAIAAAILALNVLLMFGAYTNTDGDGSSLRTYDAYTEISVGRDFGV